MPRWSYCLGGVEAGQGAGACCGAAAVGARVGAVDAFGFAAGFAVALFLDAGFLAGLGGGGAGVNST